MVFMSLLLTQRMRKGHTVKDGQNPDRPHAHEARGLARNKLASTKEDQTCHGGSNMGAPLKHNILKALKGLTHSSEALAATPGWRARTHPPEERRRYDSSL
jgi:hypothetical protein